MMVKLGRSGGQGLGISRVALSGPPLGTNDFVFSEDFTINVWNTRLIQSLTTVLSPSVQAPFGVSHLATENSATAQHDYMMAFTNSAENAKYLQWVLVKSNGRDLQMSAQDGYVNNFVNFDLITGVTTRGSNVLPGEAGMVNKGGGWWVCWAIIDTNGIAYMHLIPNAATAVRYQSYTGDGVSGVYFAAVQREALGVTEPLGYVKTP